VAQESSGTLSHKAIQIGEEMYASVVEMLSSKVFVDTEELIMAESDNKGQFEEVQEDDYFDEYMLQQETKVTDYIPLEYKIKIVSMAKEHPKWNLKTLQKKGGLRLKNMKYLSNGKKISNMEEQILTNIQLLTHGHMIVL